MSSNLYATPEQDKEHADHKFGANDAVPTQQRHCTDVFFLCVLFAFWGGVAAMIAMSVNSAGGVLGINRVLHGTQIDGKVCGMAIPDGPGVAYDKLWYYNIEQLAVMGKPQGLCVKDCGVARGSSNCGMVWQKGGNSSEAGAWKKFCKSSLVLAWSAAPVAEGFVNICMPNVTTEDIIGAVDSIQSVADVSQIAVDLQTTWWVLLLAAVFGIVLSIFYVVTVRYGGACVVYSILVITTTSFIVGGLVCFMAATPTVDAVCTTDKAGTRFLNMLGKNTTCTCAVNKDTKATSCGSTAIDLYTTAAYALWVLGGLVLCVMIFLRKSLQVAIKILTEAGHVLMDLKQMMLIPLFKFMVLAVFLVFWVTVSVYLIAGAKLQNTNDTATGSDGNGGTTTAQVFEIVADNQLYGFMVYHFFCLLWTMALIKASMDFIVGCCCSTWYFAPKDEHGKAQVSWPIFHAIGFVFRYHLGSLAFGSFIVAVIQLIKWIVEYVDRRSKQVQNKFTKALICMCKCCLWCLECCMKFITRQAYLMMAILGGNFCNSAKKMFWFNLRNIKKVGVTHGTGAAVLFFGKTFVVSTTTLICFFIIEEAPYFKKLGVSSTYPCLTCAIVAFAVSGIILKLYSTTMEALLLCFLVDGEMNGNARNAPEGLKKTLREKVDGGDEMAVVSGAVPNTGGELSYN